MTKNTCKNCDNPILNNYCNVCGQSTKTGRINLHYLYHELQHSILHVDKGILYTIKELFIRPGESIRNYLEGKRVNYFKPFGFVIILATVYGFIAHYLNINPQFDIENSGPALKEQMNLLRELNLKMYEWMYSHYSFYMLICIPFVSLSTFLLFRRNNYNYFEHIVINAYITGIQCIIYTVSLLLLMFTISLYYISIASVISFIYTIWAYITLFNRNSKISTAIKASAGIIISYILLTLIISIIIIFVFSLLYHS